MLAPPNPPGRGFSIHHHSVETVDKWLDVSTFHAQRRLWIT
jgi:hypothetical protein